MKGTEKDEITMAEIERAAMAYSATHKELAQLATEMDAVIQAAMQTGLPRLRRLVTKAHREKNAVEMLVDAGRPLFAKKRTQEFHGIKVGLQKGRGGLSIPNEDRTCILIEKHFPSLYDELVRQHVEPDKTALAAQGAGLLRKVGCEIINAGDIVVVKPKDGRASKLAKTLLQGGGKGAA